MLTTRARTGARGIQPRWLGHNSDSLLAGWLTGAMAMSRLLLSLFVSDHDDDDDDCCSCLVC